MNRRGKKNCIAIPYCFWRGEGVGRGLYRALHLLGQCVVFLWGKRAGRSLPSLSWCCLWGFVVSTFSLVQELTDTSSKSLPIFFFFCEAASQGAWATRWGFLGSMKRDAELWESYLIFFPCPAAFSSQLSLKSGQEMKGLRGRGAWGVRRTSLLKACGDSPGFCMKAEGFGCT